MRKTIAEQRSIVPPSSPHRHSRELNAIAHLLEQLPEMVELVYADLVRNVSNPKAGRNGMSAELVLRCALSKQLNDWSYAELSFHIADSASYRAFCGLGWEAPVPTRATLKRNIKRVRAETWEAVNQMMVRYARDEGIDKGRQVRTDCTVVETNIHAPTDSSLLWDCVRVLARQMKAAQQFVAAPFTDHRRRAKRRALAIQHARTKAQRLPLYRDLLKVTHNSVRSALAVADALDGYDGTSVIDMAAARRLAAALRHYAPFAERVMDQTSRRVVDGQSVPAAEKLVSIFETHTDIIRKDRRETLYGHKVAVTTGVSGLVLDVTVEQGNPSDSTLALTLMQRQVAIYGKAPRQACFDGAFASKQNLHAIKALGVKDVCFSKASFLKVTDMVKSTWVYRKLRRFRAGVEAGISFLKRCFGWRRCLWRGFDSFRAYAWASAFSHNLLVLARHQLS